MSHPLLMLAALAGSACVSPPRAWAMRGQPARHLVGCLPPRQKPAKSPLEEPDAQLQGVACTVSVAHPELRTPRYCSATRTHA